MNAEQLAAAVQDPAPWLGRFRHKTYEAAFQSYCETFGPLFDRAVREAGEAGVPALAAAVLDRLEQGWRCRRPWNRSAVRADEKQMLVVYLSPMLLEREEPGCRALCEALREAWNARRPKDAYRTAGFAKIKSGFRDAIMGIELRGLRREES